MVTYTAHWNYHASRSPAHNCNGSRLYWSCEHNVPVLKVTDNFILSVDTCWQNIAMHFTLDTFMLPVNQCIMQLARKTSTNQHHSPGSRAPPRVSGVVRPTQRVQQAALALPSGHDKKYNCVLSHQVVENKGRGDSCRTGKRAMSEVVTRCHTAPPDGYGFESRPVPGRN